MADPANKGAHGPQQIDVVASVLDKRQGSMEAGGVRTVSRTLSVGISKVLKVTFSEPSVLGSSPTKESAMNAVGEHGCVGHQSVRQSEHLAALVGPWSSYDCDVMAWYN
jgi:hypothetical protein